MPIEVGRACAYGGHQGYYSKRPMCHMNGEAQAALVTFSAVGSCILKIHIQWLEDTESKSNKAKEKEDDEEGALSIVWEDMFGDAEDDYLLLSVFTIASGHNKALKTQKILKMTKFQKLKTKEEEKIAAYVDVIKYQK
ncbi:hypothetical protein ACJX0J_022324 [Zea mays]